MTDTQLVIIGSGPAGYTAAVYAARANLSPVVIAGSVTAGGELMNTTDVENFPGFPAGVQGPELMESMREQAEKFGAEVIYDDVETLKLNPGAHEIETALGARYTAKAVILSTGSAYRELGLPNEKQLSGHGVSWCATCDGFFFRDQHIAVIGGGDSALEEATFLTRFASKVTLVHRRQELRASQAMQDRAQADEKLEFLLDSEVAEVHGEDSLTGLTIRNACHRGDFRASGDRHVRGHRLPTRAPASSPTGSTCAPMAISVSKAARPRHRSKASSPPATSSTPSTVRPSLQPAQAAQRHSTQSTTSLILTPLRCQFRLRPPSLPDQAASRSGAAPRPRREVNPPAPLFPIVKLIVKEGQPCRQKSLMQHSKRPY